MTTSDGFADRLARSAREIAGSTGSVTGRLARLGRLQLDSLGIRRQIQQELRALGERALELSRRGELPRLEEDPIAGPILGSIARLEAEISEREQQMREAQATDREEGRP